MGIEASTFKSSRFYALNSIDWRANLKKDKVSALEKTVIAVARDAAFQKFRNDTRWEGQELRDGLHMAISIISAEQLGISLAAVYNSAYESEDD